MQAAHGQVVARGHAEAEVAVLLSKLESALANVQGRRRVAAEPEVCAQVRPNPAEARRIVELSGQRLRFPQVAGDGLRLPEWQERNAQIKAYVDRRLSGLKTGGQ